MSDQIAETAALAPFAEWLKNYFTPKSGVDLVAYLGFLISVIGLIVSMQPAAPSNTRPALTEKQIIDMTVRAVSESFAATERKAEQAHKAAPAVRGNAKTGRNDPCTCGSGKKHKRCCL